MSTTSRIPEFDLPDRLRKAREAAELDQHDLAAVMGVSRATVSNAETGRRTVRRITINAWSLATGVPVEWLLTGHTTGDDGPSPEWSTSSWKSLKTSLTVVGRQSPVTGKMADPRGRSALSAA